MSNRMIGLLFALSAFSAGGFEQNQNASGIAYAVVGQDGSTHIQLEDEHAPGVQPDSVVHTDFVADSKTGESGAVLATVNTAVGAPAFVFKNSVAEFIAMTLFVFTGCGCAMAIAKDAGSAWVLQVAFTFGLAITTLAYGLGRYSGGQINCAVTLALWVKGQLGWAQAIVNFIAQMLGSVLGAAMLALVFPKSLDKTGGMGTNAIAPGFTAPGVLLGELLMTLVLVITVFESGQQPSPNSAIAVVPIGFAVFLAHCVLIPVDGCSINPTRSFGPAFISTLRDGKIDAFKDMWVFWFGPLAGALLGTALYALFEL